MKYLRIFWASFTESVSSPSARLYWLIVFPPVVAAIYMGANDSDRYATRSAYLLLFIVSLLFAQHQLAKRFERAERRERLVVLLYEQRPIADAPEDLKEEWYEIMRKHVWER